MRSTRNMCCDLMHLFVIFFLFVISGFLFGVKRRDNVLLLAIGIQGMQ